MTNLELIKKMVMEYGIDNSIGIIAGNIVFGVLCPQCPRGNECPQCGWDFVACQDQVVDWLKGEVPAESEGERN